MIKFKLKEIMEEKGIKIKELNEKTGISRNSLSLLINGKSQGVQFETIEKITRALNIEIDELFEKSFNEFKITFESLYNVTKKHKHTYQTGKVDPKTKEFSPVEDKRKEEYTFNYIGIGFKYTIDGDEVEGTILYNLYMEFNIDNILHLHILLKDNNYKNDFIYLLDNIKNFQNLLLTYITLKILENLKQNKLKKINNNFKIENKKINVTCDLNDNSVQIPLDDDLTINYEHLNYEVKKTNEKSLYKVTFDDGIYFKYKSR